VRRFGEAERRARLVVRHRLAPSARADDPVAVARSLVALHSTDPTSVVLSVWARTRAGTVAGVERALYDDRTLVRVMGMRRTVFAAAVEDARLVLGACGRDVGARERRRLVALLDPEEGARIGELEELLLAALRERGEATAPELAEHHERLRAEVLLGAGTRTEARQKVASRLLTVLAAEGRAVRARPRGTWTSTQFRWSALETWCPAAVPDLPTPEARGALAARWLEAFGPARPEDLQWWTGWGKRDTAAALDGAGAVAVALDGDVPGVALAGDLDPASAPPPEPAAALLPALDPTTMGWKHRGFYLSGHGPQLFDLNGNASPTVWWDGRIVGGWAQRRDGEVAFALLEDVGAEGRGAVAAEAARLQELLGAARLAPRARGRSPVEAALVR